MKNNELKIKIVNNLKEILLKEYNLENKKINIEKPNDFKNGNFSSNIAMVLTKELKINPREIAETIINEFKVDEIEKIEIAGPGFINFYVKDNYLRNVIKEILNSNQIIFDTNENNNYNVEYVSANPTGDLHLGHARNAVIGDSVSRLLKKINNKVDTEYYINDAGAQMKNLALSTLHFYKEILGIESNLPEDGYGGGDIKNIAKKIYKEYGDTKIDEDINWFLEYSYAINLEELKKVLLDLNIEFDYWISERDLHSAGKVEENLNILEKKGDIYIEDGAMFLKTSNYHDDKDRVLKKANGDFTYFASDVAYHIDKFNRGYTNLIDVWGGDHHGYINRVKSSIASLGYADDKFEVLIIQMINILQNNKRVKMSKRKGTSVTIRNLLEELDADTIRFFFLMRSADTQLDFDLDLAKSQSSDNPIYYIQYAHARINTLLTKAEELKIYGSGEISKLSELEKEIITHLNNYEIIIINAANKRLPHLVCNYLFELANLYHRYYNDENVFNNKKEEINDKIIIAKAIKKILADGLDTIGINAKDRM